MELYYLPSGKTWHCNTWYDVYVTIEAQQDPSITRYNIIVYNNDGTTSHYNGEELFNALSVVRENMRMSPKILGEVKTPVFEGSPVRFDEELVNRNK